MLFAENSETLAGVATALVLIVTGVVSPFLISARNEIKELKKEIKACHKDREAALLREAVIVERLHDQSLRLDRLEEEIANYKATQEG